MLELDVRDSGVGIDADFLPHVFERFRQADSTTTRKYGGLGLGLAISRSIVELHGGTITARSDGAGKGAAFLVRLPVAPVRNANPLPPPSPSATTWTCPPELAGLRVLVVDDDPDGRQMVSYILEECGAVITQASHVAEALVEFDRERPDVVLSDIGMPDRDGYSFIAEIRARPAAAGGTVPAASLTAYAGVEDRRRALNAGFNMHVGKPVEPAELVAVIANLARFARALRG
jgi:CheY-like chemotaxis protein